MAINPVLQTGLLNQSSAQVIDGSLNFEGGRNQALKRTPTTPGNRRTWTYSCWLKKQNDNRSSFFSAGTTSSDTGFSEFGLGTQKRLRFSGWNTNWKTGSERLRDYNNFYHFVIAVDYTNSTANNKVRIYKNGVEVTDLNANNTPSDTDRAINATVIHYIGGIDGGGGENLSFTDYQMSQVYFIDGQQLGPEYFGFTDPLTNTWRPKKYTGTFAIASGTPSVSNGGLVIKADGASINGTFVVNGGVKTWTSPDGVTWTRNGDGRSSAAAKYLAVGGAGTALRTFYPDTGSGGFTFYMYNGGGEFDGSSSPFTLDLSSQTYLPSQTSSFGGNGFYLPMDGNSPIGQDRSGNGNDWTPVNFGGSNSVDKATGALPILEGPGGAVANVGVRTDANASNLFLALPLVGTTNDESNKINSGSTTKIATNSSVTASTTQSNFYGGSHHWNSNTDSLLYAQQGNDLVFGTGDFTIEFWFYDDNGHNGTNSRCVLFDNRRGGNVQGDPPQLVGWVDGHNEINLYYANGSEINITVPSTVGKWWHYAAVRSGGTIKLYIDGVEVGSASDTTNYPNNGIALGSGTDSGYSWSGYIQDFRVYKTAKYTSNFIPASTNPDILPDTPSGVSGGSKLVKIADGAVSFDGTQDYLTCNSSDFAFGTGDFTVEAYLYLDSLINYRCLATTRPDNGGYTDAWHVGFDANGLIALYSNEYDLSAPNGSIGAKKWTHVVVTRDSSTARIFVDGKLVVSGTVTKNYTRELLGVGDFPNGGIEPMKGQISNLRIIKGSIPTEYQTSSTTAGTQVFTPPTRKLTNVTNTKLLCCQSNTSATAAAVAPANEPFSGAGGASGGGTTSDYLQVSSSGHSDFSLDGDFTVEWWHFRAAANANNGYMWTIGDSNTSTGIELYWGSSGSTLKLFTNGGDTSVTATAATGWHHYAVVRSSGTIKVYYDGTEGASVSNSSTFSGNFTIGGEYYNGSITGGMHGPMSQFRFVKGTAVYTSNFTAPTTALTAITNTKLLTLQGSTITDASGTSKTITVNGTITTVGISKNGNVSATTFNPFNTTINTVRGQESRYCTLSPLHQLNATITENNLQAQVDSSGGNYVVGTIAVDSGQWYWEFTTVGSNNMMLGVALAKAGDYDISSTNKVFYYYANGGNIWPPNSSYGSTLSVGDTLGVALDMDAGTLTYYKNGVSLGVAFNDGLSGRRIVPSIGTGGGSGNITKCNFGQKPFKFPPPDGFQPLNAANVRPETVISRPDQYFNTTLWSGDDADPKQINLGMAADLIWVKARNQGNWHWLSDTLRGTANTRYKLYSNSTNAEDTAPIYGQADSINDFGFVAGGGTESADAVSDSNKVGTDYICWSWKAGGSKGTFNIDDVGYANASDVSMNEGSLNSSSYNTSQRWSDNLTVNTGSVSNATQAFNANLTNGADSSASTGSNDRTMTATIGLTLNNETVEVYPNHTYSGYYATIDGVDQPIQYFTTPNGFKTMGPFTGTLTSVTVTNGTESSSRPAGIRAIKVGGKILVDNNITPPNVPSITNTGCSVGTRQGFSITKFTTGSGTSGGATIAHGLNSVPHMYMYKPLSASGEWVVVHRANYSKFAYLNATTNFRSISSQGGGTDANPTDKVLTLYDLGVTLASKEYICYAWSDVPGMQRFGRYEGTGVGGNYVYLGFRPALIWIKSFDSTSIENWGIIDSTRSYANPGNHTLATNLHNPESYFGDGSSVFGSSNKIDLVSDGFVLRETSGFGNTSGITFIYCAWAEAPQFNLYGGQSNAR